MLFSFSREDQRIRSQQRDEVMNEINAYNGRFSGEPRQVRKFWTFCASLDSWNWNCNLPTITTLAIAIYIYKFVILVDGYNTRFANIIAALPIRSVLSWRSRLDVQNEGATLFCCCLTLPYLAAGHHTRSCFWTSWFLGRFFHTFVARHIYQYNIQKVCGRKNAIAWKQYNHTFKQRRNVFNNLWSCERRLG